MCPIDKPRKRVDNPPQKLQKSSRKWIYIAVVLVIVVIAAVAFVLLQNQPKTSQNNNGSPTGNPIAVFDTSLGSFKVELFRDKMPITVNNFVKLVNDGFYNGLIFHRISANFMIQGGGYYPNGTQKTSPYGNIQFETSDVKHVDGAISMASTGSKVGGSAQFFICDGAQTSLDGNYAAFGVTVEGIDVVRSIAAQPHANGGDGTGKPNTDIIIDSITIINS